MEQETKTKWKWEVENEQATKAGFECVPKENEKPGKWCDYQKGDLHVWSVNIRVDDLGGAKIYRLWQTARLSMAGYYVQHKRYDTLTEALNRKG